MAAYLSLQTPTVTSIQTDLVESRRAQSLEAQRKRKSDVDLSSCCDSRSNKLHKSIDSTETAIPQPSSAEQPAQFATAGVIHGPSDRLEDFFDLDSHVLGSGQFGTVRRCTERATGARFACKTLLKDRITSESEREEIRREVALMQRVAAAGGAAAPHPGVVALRAVFEDERAVHVVMELCAGGELFDEVVRRGRFSERDAAHVFRQIASAVAHCHARGVLHRDLKPENILLAQAPSADHPSAPLTTKIADFGLALALNHGETARGVSGSPFYIAPEVLTGAYGLGADVWSLGVILYILLAGVPPFWGPNDTAVFVQVLSGAVDFAEPEWAGVSADAKDLIRALLTREPARRPPAEAILSHPWILAQCAPHIAAEMEEEAVEVADGFCCDVLDAFVALGESNTALEVLADELPHGGDCGVEFSFQTLPISV